MNFELWPAPCTLSIGRLIYWTLVIHEKEFYKDFKESAVYENSYQDDEDFQVIDDLLKLALVKDPAQRDRIFFEYDRYPERFEVQDDLLKSELSNLCSKFD